MRLIDMLNSSQLWERYLLGLGYVWPIDRVRQAGIIWVFVVYVTYEAFRVDRREMIGTGLTHVWPALSDCLRTREPTICLSRMKHSSKSTANGL